MEEIFLHYIWQYKLYNPQKFKLNTGELVEIINPGEHNTDSGPDFFNAKIKIDNTTWAGNVEIHVNSSDWYKHNHDKDDAYNSIILHVVFNNNKDIYRKTGEIIPCIEINFYKSVYDNYKSLIHQNRTIKCQNRVANIDLFHINHWIDQLAIERLNKKSEEIKKLFSLNLNNWEESFYQILARSFGLKINILPFELLSKSVENKILAKHKDNLFQIEALLFGQAGFLNKNEGDAYYLKLKKEYLYLQKKYSLTPINNNLWKFMRLRPANFPTIRLSQFANLIYKSSGLFSKIIECQKINDFESLFQLDTSDYWNTHYVFNKQSKFRRKTFGNSAFKLVMINAIIPLLFTYARNKNNDDLIQMSLNLLKEISPEKNAILKNWEFLNISITSAYQTQAIIQLNNEYCKQKRCLNCLIGHKILTKKMKIS